MNNNSVFIIAEAGVNHNGSITRARKMVKTAAKAGADAVKFQTFTAETLVTTSAPKADYQKMATRQGGTQFEMLKKLELSYSSHLELVKTCRANRIQFLSSPFDLKSIDSLKKLGVDKWKIPSGEITNFPYLRKIASFRQEIILSTGMADLSEIDAAVKVIIDGGIAMEMISILHCNTEYPTPMADVNLNAISTIQAAFPQASIGYSDHTLGIEVPIAAVAMGARVIEKHFTLDKALPGPDHKASVSPEELATMIRAIRNVEQALGNGVKQPSRSERKNIAVARKSIVAARSIKKGELFSDGNLAVKRPGTGVNPMKWEKVIGTTATRDYEKDELIDA